MCIRVLSHIQPVLPAIDPYCCIQVSTLKLAVKDHILSSKVTVLPVCLTVAGQVQVCLLR
jgi:hypothetical protein